MSVAMSRFALLPEEVLKHVMQYIPLKERLGSCCRVNKGFHAAAVAATRELDLYDWEFRDNTLDRVDSLLTWLDHYGEQLTLLEMSSFPRPLLQLPCPNLQELVLVGGCSVQLGPAPEGTPGVIQGCTKLKRLEVMCNIIDAPAGAVVDGNLSRLLQLELLQVAPVGVPYENSIRGLHRSTLPCMKHLTHLEVCSLSVDNLLQLGGLTNLQELRLRDVHSVAVGPVSVPGLALPASLTKLVLQSLCVLTVEAEFLSLVPAGLKHLESRCYMKKGAAEVHTPLLSSMARLQHLTQLVMCEIGDLNWPSAGPAYSALTASSKLVELSAHFRHQLPMGIWQHVFSTTHRLSYLTRLELNLSESGDVDPVVSGAWDAADVSSFVSCCPNVVEIESLFLQHGLKVSGQLQQLTALTALEVHFVPSDMSVLHGSLKGLASVTQLEDLRVDADTYSPHEVSVAILLPLTSLTRLGDLSFKCWSMTPEDISADEPPELDEFITQVRQGHKPSHVHLAGFFHF